ncbi:MAG TPA: O-antigen ligase family protein [Sphingomicrobium sp.]|nr:O-antigen ligase family protein [Sphingomicrobium sp.]
MSERLKPWAVPVYLFACLVLGGSPQGVWGTLALQLGGLSLLAWAGLTRRPEPLSKSGGWLLLIAAGAITLMVIQLIPLPPALWSSLPGREAVTEGFVHLGTPLPWLPLSLAPYGTLDSLLALIPPSAMLVGILRLGAYRPRYLAGTLLAGTLLGIVLGAVQVTTGGGYLFRTVTAGQASGFFANANYMGTLLLVSIPFTAALVTRARHRQGSGRGWAGSLSLAGSLLLLVLFGLALSRSLAAVLLLPPVALASWFILSSRRRVRRPWLLAGAVLGGALAVIAIGTLPAFDRVENATSASARQQIYRTTLAAAGKVMPVGSGFGSFTPIYAREENAATVERAYVNHAHNEYLEIALEGGVPAILLMVAGLAWWARRSWWIWRSPTTGTFVRAATVASAAILLHSLVDFPARTLAISATLAVCFALMAEPRPRRTEAREALHRPARHLTL